MELKRLAVFVLTFLVSLSIFYTRVLAEEKGLFGGGGQMIPKLPKTVNDPELFNSNVYPPWGPVCQRYAYSVIYRDKKGRKPEYVKIYFNGKMIEMIPAVSKASFDFTQDKSTGKQDYQKG